MAHPSQAWLWFWLILATDKSPVIYMPSWCGHSYGVFRPTWSCSGRRAESPSSGSAGGVFIVTDFSERLSLLRDLWCSRLRSLTNGNRKKQNTEHQQITSYCHHWFYYNIKQWEYIYTLQPIKMKISIQFKNYRPTEIIIQRCGFKW